jgi:hypothetical protein
MRSGSGDRQETNFFTISPAIVSLVRPLRKFEFSTLGAIIIPRYYLVAPETQNSRFFRSRAWRTMMVMQVWSHWCELQKELAWFLSNFEKKWLQHSGLASTADNVFRRIYLIRQPFERRCYWPFKQANGKYDHFAKQKGKLPLENHRPYLPAILSRRRSQFSVILRKFPPYITEIHRKFHSHLTAILRKLPPI